MQEYNGDERSITPTSISKDLTFAIHDLHNKLNNFIAIYDLKNDNRDKLSYTNEKQIEDHESRIRFLERLTWVGIGGLAVLQVILKFVV